MSSQNESRTEDDLFEDAVGELTQDIETHLSHAEDNLPDPDELWDVDAPNLLGVLNTLRGKLDVEDATTELREARKNYVLADRADAFDDNDTLDERLDELDTLIEELESTQQQVTELTNTVPEIKSTLSDTHSTEMKDSEDEAEPETDSDTEGTDEEPLEDDTEESEEDADETDSNNETDDTSDESESECEADAEDDEEDVPVHKPPAND